jgi:hypothetical protein
MFFVTLLMTAVEAWMRAQPGSAALRALIYFDEVLGFLPPVKEPPSKGPLMRLLKQARAFGLGLLLTTQNPVDLDYKALSNAGTWFVGRLQTEQDKARLLDGLESATEGAGGYERAEVDRIISALGKRVFLLHNVHAKRPAVFQTRWAMAYLKGPITQVQLKALNRLVGARALSMEEPTSDQEEAIPAPEGVAPTKPAVPSAIDEFFLPNNLTVAAALSAEGREATGVHTRGLLYRPVLLAQAGVRFLDRKAKLEAEKTTTCLVHEPDPRGFLRWEEHLAEALDPGSLDQGPAPEARYADVSAPLTDASAMRELEKDFLDFVHHQAEIRLLYNPRLDLLATPEMSETAFRAQCQTAARDALEAEIEEVEDKYLEKMKRLKDRIAREERELAEDESEFSARRLEEVATHFENVLGLLSGSRSRRRISTSLTKRRMTTKAKSDIEESEAQLEGLIRDLSELEEEMAEEVEALERRWEEAEEEIEERVFKPYKKDVRTQFFGVGWHPYWQAEVGGQRLELPGYGL